MLKFRHIGERPANYGPATAADGRLPRGLSLVVIALLSALSWAVLISIVAALHAVL
jgi:hypothetical protein